MVVAVRVMGKVQVAGHKIVDVVSMWNSLVAAARTVAMSRLVSLAGMPRGAGGGIFFGDSKDMFIDVVLMDMVEMAIVQVVGMTVMRNRLVAAAWSVTVGMMGMSGMCAHRGTP